MDECVAETIENKVEVSENQMDTSSQPTEQKKSKSVKEEAPKVAKVSSMHDDPLNFPIPNR